MKIGLYFRNTRARARVLVPPRSREQLLPRLQHVWPLSSLHGDGRAKRGAVRCVRTRVEISTDPDGGEDFWGGEGRGGPHHHRRAADMSHTHLEHTHTHTVPQVQAKVSGISRN